MTPTAGAVHMCILSIGGFRDKYLGGKLFRGPENRERGWGQLGVLWSTMSSSRGVWSGGGNRIWCLLALKSGIRWQQFR